MDSAAPPPLSALDELLQDEPEELTASDVARIRGWGRKRAWRWLRQGHRVHGPQIIRAQKRGQRTLYVISREQFAILIQRANAPSDSKTEVWKLEMEERMSDFEKRLDVHAKALLRMHAI